MRYLMLPLLAMSTSAFALPTQLGHQGRVLDADGLPAEGPHTLLFQLYDEEESGRSVWSESHPVDLINGYYSVVLGDDEEAHPLDDDLLRSGDLFLELTVDDDVALSPRQALNAVPYARVAGTAVSLSGGVVDATELRVDGALLVDSTGTWVGRAIRLSEEEVDAYCADNGYAMAVDLEATSADLSAALADLSAGSSTDDSSLRADMTSADDALRAEMTSADDALRDEMRAADDTLRDEMTSADDALRDEMRDADAAISAHMTSADDALRDEMRDADSVVSEDLADLDESLADVAKSGSFDDLEDVPASLSNGVVGVRASHFTESGSFTVPDGITALILYATGGGGGGSNGGSTTLDLGTHNHTVAAHEHSGGTHTHAIGDHSHEGGASHTHTIGSVCTGYRVVCGGGHCTSTVCTGYADTFSGDATGGGGTGTGSTGSVDGGNTGSTTIATDGSSLPSTTVAHAGGDGGAGGGISAIISVTSGEDCDIIIGSGGDASAAGSGTLIRCAASVECAGGDAGGSDGVNGEDGRCAITEGTVLAEYKATQVSPGGGGRGGAGSGAAGGQSGAVTIRY